MNIRSRITIGAVILCTVLMMGCKVSYSLSSASVPVEAQTVSIPFFPNTAALVTPTLSPTFTDALQQKFANQTKLTQVREDGDLSFEGEIVGYTSTPTAVTADEIASQMRLTITVRVQFVSRYRPEDNFSRTFSQYGDYPSTQMLQTAEGGLIPEIVKMLVDDIFDAALSNW